MTLRRLVVDSDQLEPVDPSSRLAAAVTPPPIQARFPDEVAIIIAKALELTLPEYARPDAAGTLLERRLALYPTPRTALAATIRTLEQKRRTLNADAERKATEKWNEKNRTEAIDRDSARRVTERQALRMRRESQGLMQRLGDALLRANRLGGQRALTITDDGGGRSAQHDRVGPPNAERAAYDRTIRLLRALLIGLERELDDLEFGAIPESGPDRDARVRRDYAGLDPAVVAMFDATTGSVSTVRRARVAGGLDSRRGTRPAREADAS